MGTTLVWCAMKKKTFYIFSILFLVRDFFVKFFFVKKKHISTLSRTYHKLFHYARRQAECLK